MHSVKEPVYYAYYELPEEAKNNLSKFVNVIAIILKCISSKSLMVFSIDIHFASDLQNQLADIARLIGYVFDSLDYWIPLVTISLGTLIMLIILTWQNVMMVEVIGMTKRFCTLEKTGRLNDLLLVW